MRHRRFIATLSLTIENASAAQLWILMDHKNPTMGFDWIIKNQSIKFH